MKKASERLYDIEEVKDLTNAFDKDGLHPQKIFDSIKRLPVIFQKQIQANKHEKRLKIRYERELRTKLDLQKAIDEEALDQIAVSLKEY